MRILLAHTHAEMVRGGLDSRKIERDGEGEGGREKERETSRRIAGGKRIIENTVMDLEISRES